MELHFQPRLGFVPPDDPSGAPPRANRRARVAPARRSQMTRDERRQLRELKQRDREVRAHERAHKQAAGAHARGGPVFRYEKGPDGRKYAVGGEVEIDASEVSRNPQATIAKMQQVRRAALAPARPSAQDRRVAAEAMRTERQARAELASRRRADVATAISGESAHVLRGGVLRQALLERYDEIDDPAPELDVRI